MKHDRRVIETKERLRTALVALMHEKGYEAITVQELLDRADVGRTTFYAHYPSKEALLDDGFDQLARWLRARIADNRGAGPLSFSLPMFEHAEEHRKLYKTHIGRAVALFQRRIRAILSAALREELEGRASDLAMPLGLVIEHLIGSYLSVLTWWLDHRTGLTPAQADDLYRRLARAALAAARR